MNKRLWAAGLLILSCGCSTMNHTEAGALGGGVIGAGLGTIIGGLTGHPLAGAAIGAGAGALTGSAIGHAEDRYEHRQAQAYANHIHNPPVSKDDVIRMSQAHVPPDQIMRQIETTGSVYVLSANDIIYLRQQGVSDAVIGFMQARRPGTVVQVRPRPVYVVSEPPPVSVGVGFGYSGRIR